MIPKGSQRAGGQQLATHLMNEFDNERVEVAEVRGAIAQDLHGAFAEWRAVSKATQCRKYLYSLSVNPPKAITRAQYLDFLDRVEKKLGLAGQPRAVIFHVKQGREHAHVVWSRIDTGKLRAVPIAHDRLKLRTVAQGFARDHGLELPPGMRRNGARDRFNARARAETLAEKQQEERTGITKTERRRDITDAWLETRDGRAFADALQRHGYILARGDRRGFVVVDRGGEVHSLARQIEGVRAKDVRERLANLPPDALPGVAEAQRRAALDRGLAKAETRPDPAAGERAEQRRAALDAAQRRRRDELAKRRAALEGNHAVERDTLTQVQRAERDGVAAQRLKDRPRGVMLFLARITGVRLVTALRERREDRGRAVLHEQQREALTRRHAREMKDMDHHFRAMARVEKREQRSLKTALHREEFQALARARFDGRARERLAAPPAGPPERQAPEAAAAFNNRAAPLAHEETREKQTGLSATFEPAADGSERERELARRAAELLEEFRSRAASRPKNRTRDRGPDRGR